MRRKVVIDAWYMSISQRWDYEVLSEFDTLRRGRGYKDRKSAIRAARRWCKGWLNPNVEVEVIEE